MFQAFICKNLDVIEIFCTALYIGKNEFLCGGPFYITDGDIIATE